MTKYEIVVTDSLEKVLPQGSVRTLESDAIKVWPGETAAFQVAARVSDGQIYQICKPRLQLEGRDAGLFRIRRIRLMPVLMATQFGADENYITKSAAMLPDILMPLEPGEKPLFSCLAQQWDGFWCDWDVAEDVPAGSYCLEVAVYGEEDREVFRKKLTVQVQKDALPAQTLLHTQWFHADCLADYYGVPVWSEDHWRTVENYMRSAARHGVNLILTPLFSLPLDTEVGAERTTCQLLQVQVSDGTYQFDFSLLDRWIVLAQQCGLPNIEICHLFTQWGAAAAPKVVAQVDGKLQRIFGWDTPAVGGEYTRFLRCLLPQLKEHLRTLGVLENTWFHISDEPNKDNLDQWKAARDSVADLLQDCHMIDALSDVTFYKQGLIRTPVVANNAIEPFVSEGVPELWTYYCCSQVESVSNRFIAMPSARTRILGTQLYCYSVKGFLHWGFNFYSNERSRRHIDPWKTADGYGSWPAGDPFLVYPGEDGMPVESIHGTVLRQAMADHRLLCLAESKLGREKVCALLRDSWGGKLITMKEYPTDPRWFDTVRDMLEELL